MWRVGIVSQWTSNRGGKLTRFHADYLGQFEIEDVGATDTERIIIGATPALVEAFVTDDQLESLRAGAEGGRIVFDEYIYLSDLDEIPSRLTSDRPHDELPGAAARAVIIAAMVANGARLEDVQAVVTNGRSRGDVWASLKTVVREDTR